MVPCQQEYILYPYQAILAIPEKNTIIPYYI